jgi:hypothetical protein
MSLLITVISVVIIFLIVTLSKRIETFESKNLVGSILPHPQEKIYIVLSYNNKEQKLQYTYDFKKFTDIKIKNKNPNELIKNISWSKDAKCGRRLILINKSVNDEKHKVYMTNQPLDLNNPVISLKDFNEYSGNDIRFIMCDLNNNYICLKAHKKADNETSYIYTLRNGNLEPVDTYSNLRLEKLFFDKDNYLCCIASNNLIYKKKLLNWKKSTWNTDPERIGQVPVLDVVFDYDGKLIAATNSGIKKQVYSFYNSNFIPYVHEEIENPIMFQKDCFKFKTGIDIDTFDFLKLEDYNFSETDKKVYENQINKFNNVLNFKAQFLSLCRGKEDPITEVDNNNVILSDIRSSLSDLKSKGYINVA